MKSYLNLLPLLVLVVGLINVMLGIFILRSQALIVSGCLLTAAGAGWSHHNRDRNDRNTRTSE